MDIKWKNRKIILIAILALSVGLSILVSVFGSGREMLKGNYFETREFDMQYQQYIELLNFVELQDINKSDLKANIVVTQEDIEEHRYLYGDLTSQISSIKDQYESQIMDAETNGNTEIADIYRKERDAKIKDISLNFTSDEHVSKKILKEKQEEVDRSFQNIESDKSELENFEEIFHYYLEDIKTGKVYTSLNSRDEEKYKTYFTSKNMRYVQEYGMNNSSELFMDGYSIFNKLSLNEGNFKNLDYSRSFKGFIGIPKSAPDYHYLIENANNYKYIQIFYIACLIIGFLALGWSLYAYKKIQPFRANSFGLGWYRRLPMDIRWGLLGISIFLSIFASSVVVNHYMSGDMTNVIFEFIVAIAASTAIYASTILQGVLIINILFERGLWKDFQSSLVYKIMIGFKDAFINFTIGVQLILCLSVVFILGTGFGIVLGDMSYIGDFIIVSLFILVAGLPILYFLIKYAGNFNKIAKAVNRIANGMNEPDLNIKGKSPLALMAKDVNKLKHGVKISQREQVKSERLKTELITNVSHDLRTPLTSIITYTDLLKADEVTAEDRQAYVEIIDRKSKRLKVLIDDLFEVSKMASGNMELVKSKVEIVQLLQQTLAEHDDSIATSDLHFRVSHDDQPIYAVVDGQKLYRVFDNLIGNILKYSLPHTRVYISLRNLQNEVEISFKNVSQFELGGNVEELFERFKRGDKSRHTEGSGLGLAIAKSIIDLHEGELDIDVDGDLFKVTIRLKKQ